MARWLLALAGLISTAIGAIGVIVPGLPTTIFLIVASYCFARSCPWLERRLLRTCLFAPYMAWLDGRRRMTRRAKAGALAAMWIAVGVSLAALYATSALPPWLAVVLFAAALTGTWAIASDLTSRLRTVRDAPGRY